MRRALAALLLTLAACAPPPSPYRETRDAPYDLAPRPEIAGYGAAVGRQPLPWSRASLTEDFIRLMFHTEWGARAPRLLRWERPATVALAAEELRPYRPFLADLVGVLNETPGLGLSLAAEGTGDITIYTAPRAAMDAVDPSALCFFVPFHGDWPAFLAADARGEISWTAADRLEALSIYIPANAHPYEVRSCLLEEATQALGPGNDLSGLADSIFNDDNAHAWPTSFDLAMLRLLYEPAMTSGLAESEARLRAFAALRGAAGTALRPPEAGWRAYDRAMDLAAASVQPEIRAAAARRAIRLARAPRMRPHRLGEAHKAAALAAFALNDRPALVANLVEAERAHRSRLAADSPHLARVRSELAINFVELARHADALALFDAAIPVFAANALDWQLAHALRWRAYALQGLDRGAEARDTAVEALAWARYVYGADSRAAAAWAAEFDELGVTG